MIDQEKIKLNIIILLTLRFDLGGLRLAAVIGGHRRLHFFIFSKIGMTCSKDGLLPGSSFIQILISLAMWFDIPGEISTRRPSVEI